MAPVALPDHHVCILHYKAWMELGRLGVDNTVIRPEYLIKAMAYFSTVHSKVISHVFRQAQLTWQERIDTKK